MSRFRAWNLLVLIGLGSSTVLAQSVLTSVQGRLFDASDAPLASAAVALVDEETGRTRSVLSDDRGGFTFQLVPPGPHRLEVSVPGFKRHVQRLVARVNEPIDLRVRLEVGAVTDAVDVVSPAIELARSSPAVETLVDNRLVSLLPLDGRNFLELSLLVPGAAPAPQGSASSVRGDFSFSVNGAREDANGFLLDGADNVDPKLNTPAVRPPVDAIREFQVLTSTYEAAYGRQGGAQVNVALKAGTNGVHGSAYEFLRNGALDARNFFAPANEPAPEYERHQFGGSIGGPIVRGRTFFFADYEGSRTREGITRVTTVPTMAERRGDFSASNLPAPRDPLTGAPIPGARIPDAFQHPVGRAIASLYPLPNRESATGNYVSSPTERDDSDHVDLRLTHAFAGGSGLSLRYSVGDRRLFEPFAGAAFAAVPGYGNDVPRRGQNLVASDTRVFTATLLNELRVGFTRVSLGVTPELGAGGDNASVGLPIVWDDARDDGLSFITVSGLSPLGHEYNSPQHGTTNAWQIADTLTWSRGSHLVKAGVDVRAVRQEAFRDVQARGFLTFTDQAYTGNALADLLLGLPTLSGDADLDNPQRLRTEAWSVFAQDSWRATPALTLSAGVRYDYLSPPVDRDDRAVLYDLATAELVPVGTGGVPRGGYEADTNNLAPRVGIAWTPPGLDRVVVRGGYGVFYNQSALAPSEGLYFSPPYFDLSLFFPLPGLPLTLSDPFPAFFPLGAADSATAFQRDLATSYLHQWSATVQTAIGAQGTLEAGYVGSRGRHLLRGRDLNQAPPSPGPFPMRPDPRFEDITIIESAGRSTYDSLQLRYQQRYDVGLTLLASYTLGESQDDASSFFASAGDANFPQDSNNPDAEWGRSSFDVQHRLSVGWAWDLPSPNGTTGWRSALLSNWQLAGVVSMQSGRPFTVALLPEFDNSNTGRSTLGFGAGDRPGVLGDATLDEPTPERWFDTGVFVVPPRGSFGNAGRNILDGPGYANVNLGLMKNLPIGATARLQLRAEAFNLFNRANFDLPDNFVGSPTFGQVRSAGSPRRLQFGAKLLF